MLHFVVSKDENSLSITDFKISPTVFHHQPSKLHFHRSTTVTCGKKKHLERQRLAHDVLIAPHDILCIRYVTTIHIISCEILQAITQPVQSSSYTVLLYSLNFHFCPVQRQAPHEVVEYVEAALILITAKWYQGIDIGLNISGSLPTSVSLLVLQCHGID